MNKFSNSAECKADAREAKPDTEEIIPVPHVLRVNGLATVWGRINYQVMLRDMIAERKSRKSFTL